MARAIPTLTQKQVWAFWRKVSKTDGCWEWVGSVGKADGYGRFGTSGGTYVAHRVAYSLIVGQPPVDLDLDHLCRNRKCCNPAHLEPVSRQVNLLRGNGFAATNSVKTHCKHGHEFTFKNTYQPARGNRECRTCRSLAVVRCKAKGAKHGGST